MQGKTFAIWGGRFRDTATAWTPNAGPGDILDMFQLGGPYSRADADRACLEAIRRNVDACAHRMLVADLGSQSYESWAAEMKRLHEAALTEASAAG